MKPTTIATLGLVLMVVGVVVHRGSSTELTYASERLGLGIELLGLGVVGFARVVQEAEKKKGK